MRARSTSDEPRKTVGRVRRSVIERIEELNRFLSRHVPEQEEDGEPIRKVVGRPRDFPIDVFVRMSGLSYADLVVARRFADIRGHEVPYLGPEGLIRLKERSLRDRDREDVIRLRALSGEPAMRPGFLRRFLSRVRTRR